MTGEPKDPADQFAEAALRLEQVIRDKAVARQLARAMSWPEKIATIERLRDATRLARQSMAKTKASSIQDRDPASSDVQEPGIATGSDKPREFVERG